ncbi:hypothetical protein CERSUDRAFT_100377 [Gelatoporia subvermispora B]|uniref:Uncharacterized protein n=1 Tax=Ceriporiopsis subvermispora (strain B) TaxID=914234 RepID=M2QHI2_CERS8|nr:hypothetical protein CERSUDRAFT_100377 [Gelatoporia subvermispora B]
MTFVNCRPGYYLVVRNEHIDMNSFVEFLDWKSPCGLVQIGGELTRQIPHAQVSWMVPFYWRAYGQYSRVHLLLRPVIPYFKQGFLPAIAVMITGAVLYHVLF